MYYSFNTMLLMLLVFHIYWWYLICAMIVRLLKNRGKVGEDIRSGKAFVSFFKLGFKKNLLIYLSYESGSFFSIVKPASFMGQMTFLLTCKATNYYSLHCCMLCWLCNEDLMKFLSNHCFGRLVLLSMADSEDDD